MTTICFFGESIDARVPFSTLHKNNHAGQAQAQTPNFKLKLQIAYGQYYALGSKPNGVTIATAQNNTVAAGVGSNRHNVVLISTNKHPN